MNAYKPCVNTEWAFFATLRLLLLLLFFWYSVRRAFVGRSHWPDRSHNTYTYHQMISSRVMSCVWFELTLRTKSGPKDDLLTTKVLSQQIFCAGNFLVFAQKTCAGCPSKFFPTTQLFERHWTLDHWEPPKHYSTAAATRVLNNRGIIINTTTIYYALCC